MKIRYIIIILTVLFFLFVAYLWKIFSVVQDFSQEHYATIEFSQFDEVIYIRAKNWGITGNHDEILLSTRILDNASRYDSLRDYVFYLDELIYKISNDSILIYQPHWINYKMPINFSDHIKVGFIGSINIKEEEYAEKGIHIIRTTKN